MTNSILLITILASFVLANFIMLKHADKEYTIQKEKLWLLIAGIVGCAVICINGLTIMTVKGLFLCMILLYAAISDIKKHEVPDFISVMILLTAFIGFNVANLPSMLLGAIVVFVPQLAIAMLRPGSYGGADIKITTALAFLLGIEKGILAMIIGLSIAIITMMCIKQVKKLPKGTAFPIVPFLAVGGMLTFLM